MKTFHYGIIYYRDEDEAEIRLRTTAVSWFDAEGIAIQHVPAGYVVYGVFFREMDEVFLEDYPVELSDWLKEKA
jgi:hypothetical protein